MAGSLIRSIASDVTFSMPKPEAHSVMLSVKTISLMPATRTEGTNRVMLWAWSLPILPAPMMPTVMMLSIACFSLIHDKTDWVLKTFSLSVRYTMSLLFVKEFCLQSMIVHRIFSLTNQKNSVTI